MSDDAELLNRYAREKDEAAFGGLVERYVDLVYSAALRQVRDAHLAQDITQMVFLRLARKADSLPKDVVLAGWLHADTRLTALQLLRAERRRAAREETIHMEKTATMEDWDQVRPVIDEALGELESSERDAVVLRFFGDRNFADVGAALRLSPDAARMRVNRALEKLRDLLEQRGIKTTIAALSAVLLANAVQSAPLGIGAKVLTRVAERGGVAAFPSRDGVSTGWRMLVGCGALGLFLVGGFFLSRLNKGQSQPPPAPTAPLIAPAVETPEPIVAGAPAAPAAATAKTLRLRVVEGGTGTALANVQVDVSTFSDLLHSARQHLATGPDGSVSINLPTVYEHDFHHRLTLSKDGYVARYVSWSVFQHDTIEDIPAEYTATLDKGIEIGGGVHNPGGQGISGVKVFFCANGPAGSPPRERDTVMWDYHTEITDSSGQWRCNHIRPEFRATVFRLEHPEYRTVTYGCTETDQPSRDVKLIPQAEYFAGHAEMRMEPGLLLGGVVVNSAGQLIRGAAVNLDRDWRRKESTMTTDADGKFVFRDLAPGSVLLTVQAPAYAPESKTVQLEGELPSVRFELGASIGLRGNIVDDNGNPVRDAEITVANDDRFRALFKWSVRTDDQGGFFWDSSPNQSFPVDVFAYGFERTNVTVQPGNNPQLITLTRSEERKLAKLRMTVVDAESQKPLDGAEILLNENDDDSPFRLMGKTVNGLYTFKTFGLKSSYGFEARAPGYLPEQMRIVSTNSEVQFALKKSDAISGTVIGPNGVPVAHAEVALCTAEQGALLSNRRFIFTEQSIIVRTDDDGRFTFKPEIGAHTIYVVDPTGFARVRLSKWQNGTPIQLLAWGRVAGVATINGQPARNIEMLLLIPEPNGNERGLTIHNAQTSTDGDGRFVFEEVPPIPLKIAWLARGHGASHPMLVEVQSGATTEVNYSPAGRTVRGRFRFAGDLAIDWATQVQYASLVIDRGLPPIQEALRDKDPATQKRIYTEFFESDVGKQWDAESKLIVISVQPDGSFDAPAVPPGKYLIYVHLREVRTPGVPFGKTLGMVHQPITVPEGSEDFDAGEIVVKGK